jgi:hypothetical protein
MHQVDATSDSEWNSLVTTKTKEYNKDMTQQFLAEASLLTQKRQDKVESFHEVKHRELALVLELGSSFEEVKEQNTQTKELKEKENLDKEKQ